MNMVSRLTTSFDAMLVDSRGNALVNVSYNISRQLSSRVYMLPLRNEVADGINRLFKDSMFYDPQTGICSLTIV